MPIILAFIDHFKLSLLVLKKILIFFCSLVCIYCLCIMFIVIKEINNRSSKQELSAIQLTDIDADYKDVDRVYDQPGHSETI